MSFSSLGLKPSLLHCLESLNFSKPSPIQEEVIPEILTGKDVLGISKTGSGKTASFVLPILQTLTQPSAAREPQILVLLPTRELTDQVYRVFLEFLSALEGDFSLRAIYGGVSANPQMKALTKVDILVATPGRLLDLISKNAVSLSAIRMLVIDEADKMLSMGFKKEVDQVLQQLPHKRQSLLFSATLSPALGEVQRAIMSDPVVVEIDSDEDEFESIQQTAYTVAEEKKGPLLRYLIKQRLDRQVLVFASSYKTVDRIINKLTKNGILARSVHSKLGQMDRREALAEFIAGDIKVLVATDLLARGVDITALPCVINYELPRSPKDYVHRIGRTGRAGDSGEAISLISPQEEHHFKVIQKKLKKRVVVSESDSLDF